MDKKEQSLLNPLSDIVFKALFGTEEKKSQIILIDFLNSILSLEGEEKIVSIVHMNPFNLQEYKGDKESILDLKIKNQKEERINIEVQINNIDDYRNELSKIENSEQQIVLLYVLTRNNVYQYITISIE